jgi:hypothetical protein
MAVTMPEAVSKAAYHPLIDVHVPVPLTSRKTMYSPENGANAKASTPNPMKGVTRAPMRFLASE